MPRLALTNYLVTPADLVQWVHSLRLRDATRALIALVVGAGFGLWLADWSAGVFAAGLAAALLWRIDSRWAFGAALALLVSIPLLELAYNANLLFYGRSIANAAAVAVWYLLAIGVMRQIAELRLAPAPAAQSALATAHAAAPRRRARAAASPAASPPPIPAWRRRLNAIEREAQMPIPRRHAIIDGLQSNQSGPHAQ